MNKDLIQEVTQSCLLTRARRISRVLTSLYDERLRPFGINAPQFTLAGDDFQARPGKPRGARAP
jgi:hypothetical protein